MVFFIGEHGKNINDYGSFFFDWSVTPIASVIFNLKNKFAGCLELSNLEIQDLPSGVQTVVDRYTGFEYPHSFPKTDKGECTLEDIKIAYPSVKQKYDYIRDKTLDVLNSQKRILFVLTGNYETSEIVELCDVISGFTKNYKVLFTSWRNKPGYREDNALAKNSRLIISPILHAAYPGNFRSWNEAFKDIDFECVGPAY